MTKANAIDIVLIYANGGKLSIDSNVKRVDIEVYFDVAMAAAVKAGVFDGIAAERNYSGSAAVLPNYGVTSQIYSPYEGTPVKDPVTGLYILQLPKVLALDNDWAIQAAFPDKGKDPYLRMRSRFSMRGIEGVMGANGFYHIEYTDAGPILYFQNLSLPVCQVRCLIAKAPSSVEADDELPYQDDIVMKAIEVAKAHFQGQRSIPADNLLNTKDVNEVTGS
jgi:hypothetical protein